MKTTTKLIALALIMFFSACETKTKKENKELKDRITALEQENQAYKNQQVKLSATVKDYRKFLGEINNNLKEIDLSSSMVGKLSTEINKNTDIKAEVRARMKTVMELIRNSKNKIMALDGRLNELRKSSNAKSEEILQLETELKEAINNLMLKETAYLEMTSKLADVFEEQVAITNELKAILNRAHYFAGTAKELKEKGIIEKEGGFIGLGRVKILNANAPDSLFNKIEKDMTDSLIVNARSIQMISNHPENSYKVDKNNFRHVIRIMDKNAFWSQGNYLVIQKNE